MPVIAEKTIPRLAKAPHRETVVPPQRLAQQTHDTVWYDELEYASTEDAHSPARAQTHVARVLAAQRTGSARGSAVSAFISLLGFDTIAYSTIFHRHAHTRIAYLPEHYVLRPYWDRYFSERYDEIDPCLYYARRSARPFKWELKALSRMTSAASAARDDARGRALSMAMARHGMNSGVTLVLATARRDRYSIVSFFSRNLSSDWISPSLIDETTALALGIHETMSPCVSRLLDAHAMRAGEGIQRSILACLASGMSTKEMASMFRMSVPNVEYHIKRLRTRHEAFNRAQLAFLCGRGRIE